MPRNTKQKDDRKTVVLLDTHAILHRAYHALPDFASSKGEPTGALYGLVTMLLKIVAELDPDYIIAAFDLPEPTYRHEAYEAYKGKRQKTDDALSRQIDRSEDIFKAFNIPIYAKAGFEADDMLGTIVEQLKDEKDVDAVVASGDMDTLQLVSGTKVRVYTLKKGIKDTIIYDETGVKERFGFGPELLPDYKGLRGDPSDNIVGVKGIGEKTATDLILNFGTIENIYKKLKKDPEAFIKAGIKPRIVELLKANEEEAQFSKMLATIRRDAPIDWKLPEESWKAGCDIAKVKELFAELEFRTLGARVEAVLTGNAPIEAVGSPTAAASEEFSEESGEEISEEELEETKIALWLVDSNFTTPTLDDIYTFAKTKKFSEARKAILEEIKKRELSFVFEEIEKPLIPIIREMEKCGVKVDVRCLERLSKEYHKELDKLQKGIWQEAGVEFNINSPKQLGEVLFDKLLIKSKKKTATGARSTKESELEKMKEDHPIVGKILEYREYQKLLSTYIDNIPKMLNHDGRLHARFNQAGAATGRMSSSDPNLQNIPVKSELGRNIRDAFIAEDGFVLLGFDYSQIELRLAAFLSGDEKLRDIFRRGDDVHAAVASQVFGVPMGEVTREMRSRAKVINFGILYGMGVNALKANLRTDRKEAQEFYNQYFATFATLADYLNRTKAEAARKGYVTTHFGRRRHFEGIHSALPYIRAQAERMAINAPIQGTQADIIKIAMRRIDEYLKREKFGEKARLILQVHDEVIYEVDEKLTKKIAPEVQEIMEGIIAPDTLGGFKLESNASVGQSWQKMETLK